MDWMYLSPLPFLLFPSLFFPPLSSSHPPSSPSLLPPLSPPLLLFISLPFLLPLLFLPPSLLSHYSYSLPPPPSLSLTSHYSYPLPPPSLLLSSSLSSPSYYSQVILTHLIISSCDFMSRKVMDKLVLFMSDFLRDSNPIAIQKLEKKCRPGKSSWSTFLPYLKVLMSPMKLNMESRRHVVGKDSAIFTKLQELGLQMTLFVIQAMASEDPHRARRQLLEEKIFTYALCLTSNVPRNLLSEARKFVTTLRSDSTKAVPIPKLNVMARAKLGSIHFGLKRVMDRSAEELKLEVSPPPPRSVGRRNPSATDSNFNPLFCIISM